MFNIMFIVIWGLSFLIIALVICLMISPKMRGKFLSNQIKAVKHMTNYAADDLKEIAGSSIEIKKSILDNNEEVLKDINKRESEIEAISIKTKTKAFKEGLKDVIYCKYCGLNIDSDSIYCKSCGKKQ